MKKIIILIIIPFILISCWNQEISKEKEKQTIKETKTILALWDSLTAWYNLKIEDAYPKQLEDLLKENNYNYKVINAWVSWDTSKNLLDRISLYDETETDLYILSIWWNDWLRKQSLEEMEANIKKIIKHLRENNPEAKIVFSWMQIPINLWLIYSNDFKEVFKKIAKEEKLIFYEFLLEWVARDVKLNLNDWIHPNKDWYTVIANNLYNFLIENNLVSK